MASALIGYTGFVGGTIARQHNFDVCYNSQNIEEIAAREFDLLVCAGAPGVKWLANKEPARDRASLDRLEDCLAKCRAKKLLLISTIDVYPVARNVDETTMIDEAALQPYGRNRLLLERFAIRHFRSVHIVRLPALFGLGLKKNFLFDLLHDNCLDWTHRDSYFQFYDMARLWTDCERVLNSDLELVNFATEPLRTAEIAQKCFGIEFDNVTEQPPVRYDMRTRYSKLFGRERPYILSSEECLEGIRKFVNESRESHR